MMHLPMISNVPFLVLLMALQQGVLGLPVYNNLNNIDPTLAEDRIGSSTSSASNINNPSPISHYYDTSLPTEITPKPIKSKKPRRSKECKRFDCWLSQFRSKEKSYGWELTFKTSPEEETVETVNKEKQRSSSEPDWPADIGLMLSNKASTSSQSNPQKSPIIDFDSLFASKT